MGDLGETVNIDEVVDFLPCVRQGINCRTCRKRRLVTMLDQIIGEAIKAIAARGVGNTISDIKKGLGGIADDLSGETARRQSELREHNANVRRKVYEHLVDSEVGEQKKNPEVCKLGDDIIREYCEKKIQENVDKRLEETESALERINMMCEEIGADESVVDEDIDFWLGNSSAYVVYARKFLEATDANADSDLFGMQLLALSKRLGMSSVEVNHVKAIICRYGLTLENVAQFGEEGTELSKASIAALFNGQGYMELIAEVLGQWSRAGVVYFDATEANVLESDWIDDSAIDNVEVDSADCDEELVGEKRLMLVSAGANVIAVIQSVRAISGLGLRDAKQLVDNLPAIIPLDESRHVWMNEAVEMLENDGATVEVISD